MMSGSWRWRECLPLGLLLLVWIWPALYNGQPFFFPDTTTYIRGADAGIQAALHRKSKWSVDESAAPAAASTAAGPQAVAAHPVVSSIKDKTVLTGRSPYYGTLLYLGDLLGGFWLTLLVQSAAMLLALVLLFRAVGMPLWPNLLITAGVLALLTAMPWYVSFLMPDAFTGIVVMGAAVLIVCTGLARWERVTWLVLLTIGLIFHDSHMLILAGLLACAVAINVFRRRWGNWRGLAAMAAALLLSFLAQEVFNMAVKHALGVPPLRPPFVTARLIEDGPGAEYLRATCPGSGFVACRFVSQLPETADHFLWSFEPRYAAFGTATPDVRRALSAEQMRFARSVFAYDPWGELAAMTHDASKQLVMLGLMEFRYEDEERSGFEVKIPQAYLNRMRQTPAFRGTILTDPFSVIMVLSFATGLVLILVVLATQGSRGELIAAYPNLVGISLWIIAGAVLNDAMCGVLSGPHDRYGVRVEWLIPLMATLLCMALWTSRRASRRTGRPAVPSPQSCSPA